MDAPEEPQADSPDIVKDEEIDTNWDEAIETFDNMDLREELLRGIYAYGFEKPSAIQQRVPCGVRLVVSSTSFP